MRDAVYVNDPAYWQLSQTAQRALRRGQLTPHEAALLLRPLLPFRLQVKRALERGQRKA